MIFAPDDSVIIRTPPYRGVRTVYKEGVVFVWFALTHPNSYELGTGRSFGFKPLEHEQPDRDLHAWLDNNWTRVTRQPRSMGPRHCPCDGVPWEIHDIPDRQAREAATQAFQTNADSSSALAAT